jgi:hypothetical protein
MKNRRTESALEEINERFNKELEGLTRENANSVILTLGWPSDILLSVGIEDKLLKYYGNKLMKKAGKHGFSPTDLKNLPASVAAPIAIFEGGRPGSFAILTDIEINGNNVLVILEVGKDRDTDFNIITSTYPKTRENVIKWANEGKLLYEDEKRTPNYLGTPAPIAGAVNSRGSDPTSIR